MARAEPSVASAPSPVTPGAANPRPVPAAVGEVSGAPQDASALLRRARHLLGEWWRLAVSAARLAIGVPDYDTYVEHLRRHHPGREPMSYEAFFAERLAARYGKGRSRCC